MNIWSDEIARKARDLSIVAEREAVIVGTPVLLDAQQLEVGDCVSRLLQLLVSLPDRLKTSQFTYAVEKLGLREEAAKIVLGECLPLSGNVFARADIVRQNGSWKLLEMNVGSTVGGMFYTSLPRLSGFAQSYDALETWAKTIKNDYCTGVDHVGIFEDSAIIEELRPQFELLAKELSVQIGAKCSVLSPDEVWIKNGVLNSRFGPVDCVYRFFNEKDVLKSPDQYAALMAAITNNLVTLPMGFHTQLLSNKGALALLHELVDTPLMSDSEKALVNAFVPYTTFVTSENIESLKAEPRKWVIKPTDSACGLGVAYGGELSEEQWLTKLESIISSPVEPYIAQHYCEAEQVPTVFSLADGTLKTEMSSIVWGVYVFGERYLGTLVRAKHCQGTIVINHATGASVGPLSPA
ncbi:hypothetical protein [Pseudomonas fluorescens]|uniref:Glutathionylspermidine synthase pre-ATP-grasp-like domain-containing protein n=1 Tax=Pseudomonas fluorescens TaxID=294 RepID=A0A423LW63_PSEFL|nr:hypothetical protein [Pseudomonas fluorescens]RON72522.1 hypothetical protein BK671_01315 [Pseudomonas fluorescens]